MQDQQIHFYKCETHKENAQGENLIMDVLLFKRFEIFVFSFSLSTFYIIAMVRKFTTLPTLFNIGELPMN